MATYYGKWVTKQYSTTFVNGEVWASINFVKNSCSFIIKYNGTYRTGLVKRLETDIYDNGGVSKIFNTQNISFKANSISFDTITGDYTTTNPSDVGIFKMHKSYFDIDTVYNNLVKPPYKNQCCIL